MDRFRSRLSATLRALAAGAGTVFEWAPLKTLEVALTQLLGRLPVAAYSCDADGRITYFNDNAAALWGRSPRLNSPVDRFCGSFRLSLLPLSVLYS